MKLLVSKNAIFQYFMLYGMLILNQSQLYMVFLRPYETIIFIILAGFLLLRNKRIYGVHYLYCILLLVAITFTRIQYMDMGILIFFAYINKILITILALDINRDLFLTRMVKLVYTLSWTSMIGTGLSKLIPDVLNSLLPGYPSTFHYKIWTSSTEYTSHAYTNHGLFTFTYFEDLEFNRLLGIFTEPGVFQMVLIAALIVLVFRLDCGYFSDRIRIRYLGVLTFALILCQSTTGYFAFLTLVIYMLVQKVDFRMRNKILLTTGVVVLALLVDYVQNGDASLFQTTLWNKLVDDTGKVTLNAGTGFYRMNMILASIEAMVEYPLGAGQTIAKQILAQYKGGGVAAEILSMGAMLGVPIFLITLYWLFYPILKSDLTTIEKIILIFVYWNTALAQSSPFYPTLIVWSVYLYSVGYSTGRDYDYLEEYGGIKPGYE